MREGLLWFDDDPARDLAEKVARAAQQYRRKYGAAPDACYVHPSAVKGTGVREIGGVRVSPKPSVLRHHFWLGREGAGRRRGSLAARASAAHREMTPEQARELIGEAVGDC
jgi:hypothetical protein